jgi:hypothetical protein
LKHLFRLFMTVLLLALVGCAHAISITPGIGSISADGVSKIEKNVGYYISPEDLAKVVETAGGGGDKVKYFPYKEAEPALKQILENIFHEVYPVPSLVNVDFITNKNIDYVFIPLITTYSSSRSMWIWPPSDFTMQLKCRTVDATGNEVWETTATGDAHERLPDVARDHGLAGREATSKAFSDLQGRIISSGKFQ